MDLSADVIDAASRLKSAAVQEVLAQAYPHVYRLATALSGREDVGRGTARFVLTRSMRVMQSWGEELDARLWFLRYTILNTRRAARHRADLKNDALLGEGAAAEFLVFVAAMRKLPHQQQEAFLLAHGEKTQTRIAAVAMDCSTRAFENHLKAAEESLRLVAHERFDEFVKRVGENYASLAPREELILPRVQSVVRRYVWPRRFLRMGGWIVILGIVGAVVWWGPKLFRVVEF